MAYLPIEQYGVIGDMHTAALVGPNGSIDWLCFPHFDSPSIFAAILDDKKGGYFQIAPVDDGSDKLDASNLLMPMVKFLGPRDPRMLASLESILEELTFDSLVYRYGEPGQEGSFSACSFWLVECLTRANRLDEARLKLEKMFSYANHLGLFAEEIGIAGEMLGNYPQALTHLGLISATINLDKRLGVE